MEKEEQNVNLLELVRLVKAGNQQAMTELLAIYQPEIDKEIRLNELSKQEQEELQEILVLSVLEAAKYFDETMDYTAMTSQEIEKYMQENVSGK
ncbi:helix-turn-helix domain-containing protein [Enterococcus sp. DIV1420a]|uniref:helix-turn-helix domain-containing protein n=1 Tax=Enterococcus TaxID=1350 RepID=UPI003F25DF41